MMTLCRVPSLPAVGVIALFSLVAVDNTQTAERDYRAIAGRIQQTYKSRWSELPPDKQKHWALRMYRITGDTTWYPAIKLDLQNTLAAIRADADSLSDSAYALRRVASLKTAMDWGKRKNGARRELFKSHSELLLQLNLLYNLATVDDYRLEDSLINSDCLRARILVQPKTVSDFLIDSATILSYGPQAANAVEYLRQLDFVDIRPEFLAAYQRVFSDSNDKKLDNREFGDKVYGLTHIIIAASGYYQRGIDAAEYQSILDYFRSRQDRIIKRLSADIIAEVGLCFLLSGEDSGELIDRCRTTVGKAFDSQTGLILSTNGDSDIASGEHRNILAYMLFNWPTQLHPGPRLVVNGRQ